MKSPFPGMDPYLEQTSLWRDVHHRLITVISEMLQPQLVSRGYVSRAESRVWLEEPERAVFPDVSVMRRPHPATGGTAVAEIPVADEPVYLEVLDEEIEEPYLQIYEIGTRRLVTGIEVISPSNKSNHIARELYIQKRDEFRANGVNLVEIDLLRGGRPLVRLPWSALKGMGRDVTIINIMRIGSTRYACYPLPLRQPLPRVTIPLKQGEPDVALNLQAALDHIYETGAYEVEINYHQPPEPALSPENAVWSESLLSNFLKSPPIE